MIVRRSLLALGLSLLGMAARPAVGPECFGDIPEGCAGRADSAVVCGRTAEAVFADGSMCCRADTLVAQRVSDDVRREERPAADTIFAEQPPKSRAEMRQMRRDSIRARKKVWISVLGGPSYTPEASLGVGGAMLMSFRMNRQDTVSQRSFIPVGFNLSLNGTIVVAGAASLFMNQNRFRVYIKYSYRDEPSDYFGVGYDRIAQVEKGRNTTQFHKRAFQLYPRFVWEVRPSFYLGALIDAGYTTSFDINSVMAEDPYFRKFKPSYTSIGVGATVQYDTRDDVATPGRGVLLSLMGTFYLRPLGSTYNYQKFDLEYRQFLPVFRRRSVLGWTFRSQMGLGDIPFTELPMFGSPFDLRGYYWGKYRDKSMAYALVEYRHMFGSETAYRQGRFYSKLGFVVWGGTGTIGTTPVEWTRWKWNYGVGLRVQVQPRKNFRLDVGHEPGQGFLFYMNMTEAF